MSKAMDIGKEYEEEKTLTHIDHLESILFQFVNLYERWSEDRQVATKQGADIAKLIKLLAKEIDGLKDLEPIVRDQLVSSIHTATRLAAQDVGKELNKEANQVVNKATEKLMDSVDEAQRTLHAFQAELASSQWIWMAISMLTSVVVGFVIVWGLMPKPTLPLTSQQVGYLETGRSFNEIWPKLSPSEREHFKKLAKEDGIVVHG